MKFEDTLDENEEQKDLPLKVEIRCVYPPDEDQQKRLEKFFMEKYNADSVEIVIKKDPSAVDGFNIFVGDDNYDWTTLGRIRQLRKSIQKLPKENEFKNIISLIKDDIEGFELDTGYQQVGEVVTVGDGIAVINGLREAAYGEIVLFDSGVKGMVQDIRTDGTTGIILFADASDITEGSRVVRTGRTAGIPISTRILGRMIDPLGKPIDGGPPIGAKKYYPIEKPAPGIIDRKSVCTPMETGILTIDSMFPIGRGQRELIIGDRQTGKTSVAIDTILNQKGKDVVCVYVAISQKASSVAKVVNILKKNGAMDYTVIVSSPASDAASLQYIAPYSGCAVAEYFMNHGRDTLIIYDDLSKHAVAYRTISLLLERAPGREAYPGDVFYLHSRLLERSAQLSDEKGGGSMTALPIVETQAGDVSAYIPTNIISITDGQIFLDSELFYSGQRPAVNVGLSVSRVGGAAQTNVMKKSVGSIRLDLAQYREMQVFSQFGSDLDEQTLKQLKYGAGLMQLLKQPNQTPLSLHEQVILLLCAREKMFINIPVKDIPAVKNELLKWFDETNANLCMSIEHKKVYSDKMKKKVLTAAKEFFKKYNKTEKNK
ncbi:MAG: F0F1 ATP synthase subunit alpha [Lachnospiraceae bacterium]|nr:F0F1 ATP synthase subunit alpha [Lachnospiraceae bacterium]